MLNSKQRASLRALANDLEPIFQIGKGGSSDNLIQMISDALDAHELIKGHVLENSGYSTREACDEICQKTGADGVQCIGSKLVIYRESKENKKLAVSEHKVTKIVKKTPKKQIKPGYKKKRAEEKARRERKERREMMKERYRQNRGR